MERVMERVIEVRGIKKAFGDHEVLRGVDFAANKGEDRPALGQREGEIRPGTVLVFVADPGSVGEFTFEELVEDRGINFSGKAKGCGA